MDDTAAKSVGQMANGGTQVLASDNTPQVDSPQPVQFIQPPQPISPRGKEHGPAGKNEFMSVSEPTEMQPEIAPEVKEAGVEASVDVEKMQLSVEHQLAGMEHAKESVPVMTEPTGRVVIPELPQAPFTAKGAVEIIKTTKTDDSQHWLAILLLSILHKLHVVQLQEKSLVKAELAEKAV